MFSPKKSPDPAIPVSLNRIMVQLGPSQNPNQAQERSRFWPLWSDSFTLGHVSSTCCCSFIQKYTGLFDHSSTMDITYLGFDEICEGVPPPLLLFFPSSVKRCLFYLPLPMILDFSCILFTSSSPGRSLGSFFVSFI